ncbi:MAG: AAA family ATPase [Bacilli bacterium]|nr:AAA family ATPase [Bacilli bacterium]
MAKIYILGAVGSGKSTLAGRLSKELSCKHFSLDDVIWEYHPEGDKKRSKENIKSIFEKILKNKNWIIEDVGRKIFRKGMVEADTILYLKISRPILYKRIISRWYQQRTGKEPAPYKPTFKMLKQMLLWANDELRNSKLKELEPYQEKIKILNAKTVKTYSYNKR